MNGEFSPTWEPTREGDNYVVPLEQLPLFIRRECRLGFVWLNRKFEYDKNKPNYQRPNSDNKDQAPKDNIPVSMRI